MNTAHKVTASVADMTLDVTGLNCPMSILKAKKAIKNVPRNGTLEVMATDPLAVQDFEAFSKATGNQILKSSEKDGVFYFLIKHTA